MSNATETTSPKKFVYVPPTPPCDLVDSTCFTIDSAGHKFLHVGLDFISTTTASTVLGCLRMGEPPVISREIIWAIILRNFAISSSDDPIYK